MAWVRIDENFSNHPKTLQVGPLGMAMQVAALCYCNKYLTDGLLPTSAVPNLLNLNDIFNAVNNELVTCYENVTYSVVVKKLTDSGLWEEVSGGYLIHDYFDYQPTKQKVILERNATAARVKKFNEKRNAKSNAVNNSFLTPLLTDEKRDANSLPDPDPVLKDPNNNNDRDKLFRPLGPLPQGMTAEQLLCLMDEENGLFETAALKQSDEGVGSGDEGSIAIGGEGIAFSDHCTSQKVGVDTG